MELFRIADGRAWFYQWDLDQQILVNDPDIQEVHFCNGTTDCSLVVEVKEGAANVPNILLQQARNIKIYAMQAGHTCGERILIVRPRTKPADYVYTETEVKRYEDLEKQIAELRRSIPSVLVQSVNGKTGEVQLTPSDVGAQPVGDYALRSEIPSVPVQSVNGKTGDVNLSAADVGALPSDTPIPGAYTLPTASAEVKGGVKVGNGLQMKGEVLEVVSEGEYELIEKIIIGYELLTAQPEDWDTNWTAYYRNTGTNKQPTYTLINDASTPAWGTSSYFKLIDDYGIDQIIRNTDPDGNPYKFEALMITTRMDGNENSISFGEHLYLYVCPGSNNTHWASVGLQFHKRGGIYDTRTYTRKNKGTWELYGYHGESTSFSSMNGQTTCGVVQLTANKEYITWLRLFVPTVKLPRNMVIRIWGVRVQ